MARVATVPQTASIGATPERLRHAKVAEVMIVKETVISNNGVNTNRRQLLHPFTSSWKRGWISEEMHAAGCHFLELMAGARASSRTTSSYISTVDNTASGMYPGDRREYYSKLHEKAKAAIRARDRNQFISWLEGCEERDMSVAMLGAMFTGSKHRHAVLATGQRVLCTVLEDLAEHFGYLPKYPKNKLDTNVPASL